MTAALVWPCNPIDATRASHQPDIHIHLEDLRRLTERRLDHTDLGRGRVEPGEGGPVIDDDAGADNLGSAVDGTGDEGDLEEGGELVELGSGGPRMDEAALRGASAWRAGLGSGAR